MGAKLGEIYPSGHGVQNTEYRIQNTEYRIQNTELWKEQPPEEFSTNSNS